MNARRSVAISVLIILFTVSTIFFGCVKDTGDSSESVDSGGAKQIEIIDDKAEAYEKFDEIVTAFAWRVSYRATTEGETVASFMNYKQIISSELIKNGEVWFSDYASTSAFVKLYHTVYVCGDEVVYKHNDEKAGCNRAEYGEAFGVAPCDGTIGGYFVTEENVLSATYKRNDSGETETTVEIDGEAAGEKMKVQMVRFGNLSSLPVFLSLQIVLRCNNLTELAEYEISADYRIEKEMGPFGKRPMTCKMKMVTVIGDYDGELNFPQDFLN